MTLEGGKPLVENSDEVGWTAAAFDYYAEMGRNFAGRVIPSIESTQLALVVKEPIGAWGCIVPWNYPLLLLAWKLAPALAAGNTVVAKPSELTPLSTLMLAPCFDAPAARRGRTSWPAPATWARRSWTTSASTAWRSRDRSRPARRWPRPAPRAWRAMNLEMGGKDPFIVCADVAGDVDVAAKGGAWAAYLNAGQVCTSAERFYVAREVYDDFVVRVRGLHALAARGRPARRLDRRRADGVGAAAREGRGAGRGGRGGGRDAARRAATAPGSERGHFSRRRS